MDERVVFLPQPKSLTYGEGSMRLNAETQIVLLPDAAEGALLAAQQLRAEIARATGLRLPIVKTQVPLWRNVIVLADDLAGLEALVSEEGLCDDLRKQGDQAYVVEIQPGRAVAGGAGLQALRYGAQTLRQVARQAGGLWPALTISDHPCLPNRGVMMDVCRGKVPTMDTLKWVVDEMALYKMNVLQLYTEHTFKFAHHPRIGEDCGSLSSEDMLELDAYAKAQGVELIPNLNSFGHCEHVLSMPEYAHLAESDVARWSLCPVDEEVFNFLDELYGDMLPSFTSEWFNVGCDETWDLGKGRSKEACEEKGTGRVYIDFLLRLRELAAGHGKRIQIWGDILLHYPELVGDLPEDVLLLDWHYGAADDYPSVGVFQESGRAFWVCSGTSSWNSLFPRIDNANVNIRNLTRQGYEAGATGLLNTDWGDHGHYQQIGLSLYGYLFGAEQSWTGGITEDADFDARFGRLAFGPKGDTVVEAIRTLGHLQAMDGIAMGNSAGWVRALLDEPLIGPMLDAIPDQAIDRGISDSAKALDALLSVRASTYDPISVDEMAFSAELHAFTAKKQRACEALNAQLTAITERTPPQEALAVLAEGIDTLRALDAELVRLVERFRAVWLRRAREAEMRISLGHFQGLRDRLALACEWLAERSAEIEVGEAPNVDLEGYQQWAGRYYILGEKTHERLRAVGAL